ncbi:MAG TPA: cell division protein ZapA [Candidatus Polarisedimenticolia bacterium]|jgi:cell division protein ZapA|nr:cell division protein ZapA [Candidatus Polarisedimenticolia bacterium]
MDKNVNLVPVEIFGQTYNLRGEGDTSYITRLAAFVDQKMREVSDTTATVDSLKVAILAALNIADEHFQKRGAEEELHLGMTQRLGLLVEMLDRALPGKKEAEKSARRDAGAESS